MQNPNLVTTQAFDGVIGEIAAELGVTDKRIYEILGRDNPYPKCWRLFNPLGRIAPERLKLIQADFNARCDRVTRITTEPVTDASLHKETSEAVQACISRAPRDVRRQQITEAIAELQKELDAIDAVENAGLRAINRFAS